MTMTGKSALALALGMILLSGAQAQKMIQPLGGASNEPAGEPKLPVVKLTLTPAAEPVPALRHKLLPDQWEQKPGNAAPYYYRALLSYASVPEKVRKQFLVNWGEQKWAEAPLQKLPKKEIHDLLGNFRGALGELETAAHRERCDWDLRLQDLSGPKVVEFLLPELGEMRNLARLVALKARLEIAEGRPDDALGTLRVGYKLARDSAKPPLLINGLVGIAIARIMDERVQELIDSSGSPNLYWALAALPDPMIDLRPAIRYEMGNAFRFFPFLKDAETAEKSSDEWRQVWGSALRELGQYHDSGWAGDLRDWSAQGAAAAVMMKSYPNAKRELIASGYTPEQVEAMPVGQVMAIQSARTYRYVADEMAKWSTLPYPQARERRKQAEQRLKKEGYLGQQAFLREMFPLADILLPALNQARYVGVRFQREIAALQTIEAIRMHAAGNDGRLPESLKRITVVPAALDPLTGKPFPYRLEGRKAILDVPSPPERTDKRDGRRYEIVIVPLQSKAGE